MKALRNTTGKYLVGVNKIKQEDSGLFNMIRLEPNREQNN